MNNPVKKKRSQKESVELIASMLKQGMTKEVMAKSLGVKVSSLHNWMAPARKLAFPQPEIVTKPAVLVMANRSSEPLPHMNAIAVDAMWKGLERWRDFS